MTHGLPGVQHTCGVGVGVGLRGAWQTGDAVGVTSSSQWQPVAPCRQLPPSPPGSLHDPPSHGGPQPTVGAGVCTRHVGMVVGAGVGVGVGVWTGVGEQCLHSEQAAGHPRGGGGQSQKVLQYGGKVGRHAGGCVWGGVGVVVDAGMVVCVGVDAEVVGGPPLSDPPQPQRTAARMADRSARRVILACSSFIPTPAALDDMALCGHAAVHLVLSVHATPLDDGTAIHAVHEILPELVGCLAGPSAGTLLVSKDRGREDDGYQGYNQRKEYEEGLGNCATLEHLAVSAAGLALHQVDSLAV